MCIPTSIHKSLNSSLTCLHLQGSLLQYARQLAEVAADRAPTTDCVLTVPSYFTPAQRGALLGRFCFLVLSMLQSPFLQA